MNDKTELSVTDVPRGTAAGGHAVIINVPGCPLMVRAVDYNSLRAEKDRLAACLKKANINIEHFEYEWYLRGDELDALRAQLAEAHAALKTVMRNAELSKEPCGSDPESPAAIRNGKFAGLASIAAQGLGMVCGPSLTAQLAEAQRNAERWSRAAHCARLDQFGGFVVTPDEPAFASDVSLAFIREIDAAIDAAKGEKNGTGNNQQAVP